MTITYNGEEVQDIVYNGTQIEMLKLRQSTGTIVVFEKHNTIKVQFGVLTNLTPSVKIGVSANGQSVDISGITTSGTTGMTSGTFSTGQIRYLDKNGVWQALSLVNASNTEIEIAEDSYLLIERGMTNATSTGSANSYGKMMLYTCSNMNIDKDSISYSNNTTRYKNRLSCFAIKPIGPIKVYTIEESNRSASVGSRWTLASENL